MRRAAIAIGFFVIFVGAADVMSRAMSLLGEQWLFTAFGPAITIVDPSALARARGATATSTQLLEPVRLTVLSLGIDAAVVPVQNKPDGSMDVPKQYDEIGWYSLGPVVGAPGNAVFAGHVNNALTTTGVFANLSQIQIGDLVEIRDAQGMTLRYRVSEIANYPVDGAPAETIFAKKGSSQVVLITCEGDWDQNLHSFDRRLVVFAKPAF